MLDIEKTQYSVRKKYVYDNDIAILFYKGQKVGKAHTEDFRGNWFEELQYFDNITDFLNDVAENVPKLDEEDNKDNWENIWNHLDWNNETKSYKYKNWEWIVLDI